ncbi:hypothetical protein [Mobiluncus porci]|uniref:Uncharacterized protein n=1 Tax=Mobiluncus porci TaxID=2652278 RepID=A0A7K0K0D0_9ACTO|nr:hypothetical protein [Mobiluncus porci]MST48937.1 hypothetical protein [Mobiluncus porci]
MSLTLSLFPEPENNVMRIRAVSDTDIIRLQRLDYSGWVPVRMRPGQLPAKDIVIEDFEAPIGRPIRYQVQAESQTAVYAEGKINSRDVVLSLPQIPAQYAVIPVFSQYDETRRMPGSTDLIIGRTDPLITILPLSDRQGTLTYVFDTYSDARNVEKLYAQGYPLLLRQPCHDQMDLYHTAEQAQIRQGNGSLWELTVQYVEQNRPGGDLVGTVGWDYQSLINNHADFVAMEAVYDDYGAVLIGVRNDG